MVGWLYIRPAHLGSVRKGRAWLAAWTNSEVFRLYPCRSGIHFLETQQNRSTKKGAQKTWNLSLWWRCLLSRQPPRCLRSTGNRLIPVCYSGKHASISAPKPHTAFENLTDTRIPWSKIYDITWWFESCFSNDNNPGTDVCDKMFPFVSRGTLCLFKSLIISYLVCEFGTWNLVQELQEFCPDHKWKGTRCESQLRSGLVRSTQIGFVSHL